MLVGLATATLVLATPVANVNEETVVLVESPDDEEIESRTLSPDTTATATKPALNLAALIALIQQTIQTQIAQSLAFLSNVPTLFKPKPPASVKDDITVPVDLEAALQALRNAQFQQQLRSDRPFYPMANPFLVQTPAIYEYYQPQPSLLLEQQYPRRQSLPAIDETLSEKEALEELNAIKNQYESVDASNRFLLPSMTISPDKMTITIVRPNLSESFNAITSNLGSIATAMVTAVTNLKVTTTTKTILMPVLALGAQG